MAQDETLSQSIETVKAPWVGSNYYQEAERWTFVFWDAGRPFRKWFDRLDLTDTIDLACGHGRHGEKSAPLCGRLTMIDVLPENVDVCRRRLGHLANVDFASTEGASYPVPNASVSAIYCYDAMVHFSPMIVESYLTDTARVLRPGGMALFHHSNYAAPTDQHYGLNPHARNHMTLAQFSEMAQRAGLAVSDQMPLAWGGEADLDGLTLVQRPT